MNFNDVAIVSIKGNDYRIYFWYMSKDDAINIMSNSNLNEIQDRYNFFSLYKTNKEVILNRAKRYYHDFIERLRERAKNKYNELPEEEKDIKREYE